MTNCIKKFLSIILIWRNLISIPLYLANKKIINQDLEKYLHMTPYNSAGVLSFNYAMLFNLPFRSIFRFRVTYKRPLINSIVWLTPNPLKSIEIGGEIGGGLAIFHNYGCVIVAHKIGNNLSVGQGVTIGRSDRKNIEGIDSPIIGDNVRICTNATVFGPITIGDNVIVGAGAVLCESIPNDCIVIGNPAFIIRKNGEKCHLPLYHSEV